jgi:hypothetical protein
MNQGTEVQWGFLLLLVLHVRLLDLLKAYVGDVVYQVVGDGENDQEEDLQARGIQPRNQGTKEVRLNQGGEIQPRK